MRRTLIFCLLALLLVPLSAQATPRVQHVGWRDLNAWLVRDDTLPIITIEMAWRGGSATDPKGKEGLSALMARLMNEGAGELNAEAFQQVMADNAISFGFSSDRDAITASLRCLRPYRDTCFRLLRLAVQAPRFDEEAIARMKAEQKAALRRGRQNPSSLADRQLMQMAYPTHVYGRPGNGTHAALDAIERDDIKAHYQNALARANLQLAVVGAISRSELRRVMRDVFGALPRRANTPKPVDIAAQQGPLARHIQRDGPQTTVLFAHHGIDNDHPLFFPAFVMNSILGGAGFSSRLTEQLREARGLAYSVYSYFAVYENGGLWRGAVASDNRTAQQALDIIRAEMRRMAQDGVSEARLKSAQTYLTGAYALRFDSGRKIAQQLIGLQQMGRSVDYLTDRNEKINAVTTDDIKRAAQLLQPDALLVSSVGGQPLTLAPPAQTP